MSRLSSIYAFPAFILAACTVVLLMPDLKYASAQESWADHVALAASLPSSVYLDQPGDKEYLLLAQAGEVDLDVQQWVSYDNVRPGGEVEYAVSYANLGSTQATDVVITDTLPLSATLVSVTGIFTPTQIGNQLIWQIGALTASGVEGGSVFYVRVQLSPELVPGTQIANTLEISSASEEINAENNLSVDSRTVLSATPDLLLQKYSDGELAADSEVTYVLAYYNQASDQPANYTLLTDTLPAGMTFRRATWRPRNDAARAVPITPTLEGPDLTFDLGTINYTDYFGSVYVTAYLSATVNPPGASVTNHAQISTQNDTDLSNNITTSTNEVVSPNRDLFVSVSQRGLPVIGTTYEYLIQYANYGNATTENVVLTHTLPIGTSFVSATDNSGNPRSPDIVDGQTLVWYLGNLIGRYYSPYFGYPEPPIYVTVALSETVGEGTALIHTTEIRGAQPDIPDSYQNIITGTTYAQVPTHEMHLEKSIDSVADSYLPGTRVTWSLSVQNNGNVVEDITITDTLPLSMSYSTYAEDWGGTSEGGWTRTVNGRQVTWRNPAVSPGSWDTFYVSGIIDPNVNPTTELTNSAVVSASGSEATQTAQHTITVQGSAIAVSPTQLDFGDAYPGHPAQRTFQVSNVGVGSLTVTDLSADSSWLSLSPVTLTVPTGQTRSVTVTLMATQTESFVGMITLQSNDYLSPEITLPVTAQVIEPPIVSLSVQAIEQAVRAGDVETITLTVSNQGVGDLRWKWKEDASLSVDASGRQNSGVRVLLVYADEDPITLVNQLAEYADVSTVDTFDARYGTPTIETLHAYDVVITWATWEFADAFAMGNLLADYVDQGGAVINTLYSWSEMGLAGRFVDEAYVAMHGNYWPYNFTCLGVYASTHPIMEGITNVCSNRQLGGTTLTASSSAVAYWEDGEIFVAAKDNLPVVSIGAYIGQYAEWDGQIVDVIHNAILYIADALPWLVQSPVEETTAANAFTTVELRIDATHLITGTYSGQLILTSNDPVSPWLRVPITLNVAGSPSVQVLPTPLDFGQVYVGYPEGLALRVMNLGAGDLNVSQIELGDAVLSTTVTSFRVAPGATFPLTLTYAPTTTGILSTTVFLSTDDPVTPTLTVEVTGYATGAPVIDVTPTVISRAIDSGDIQTVTLAVANMGDSALDWSLDGRTYVTRTSIQNGGQIGLVGNNLWPLYNALSTGTLLGDRYTFEYLGDSWATSVLRSYDLILVAEPSYGLTLSEVNALRQYYDSGKPIVFGMDYSGEFDGEIRQQIDTIFGITSAGEGSFVFGTAGSHPIAQDIEAVGNVYGEHFTSAGAEWVVRGTDGNTYVLANKGKARTVIMGANLSNWYSASPQLVRNAIEWANASWLNLEPLSGSVPAGATMPVTLTLDATGLISETYQTQLTFVSNDPATSRTSVPVTLAVRGFAVPSVVPTALDFGAVYAGFTSSLPLELANAGSKDYQVITIESSNAAFSITPAVLSVPPHSSMSIDVTFAPTTTLSHDAFLTISTDSPLTPTLTVALTGTVRYRPIIQVTPSSLSVTQGTGVTTTRSLVLANQGQTVLDFAIAANSGLISVDPISGTLAAGSSRPLTVTFDSTQVASGTYLSQIDIDSNDPVTPTLSAPVTFTVILTAPETPANPQPADAQQDVPSDAAFSWQASPHATWYHLYLWTEGSAKPATPTVLYLTNAWYQPPNVLPTRTLFHWQVVAGNVVGQTPGPEWTFRSEGRPDFLPQSLTVPATATAGETLPLTWTVINAGDEDINGSGWYDSIYLSLDTTFDPNVDILAADVYSSSGLAAGEIYSATYDLNLDDGLLGDYYVFVVVDRYQWIAESNEDNNVLRAIDPIAIGAPLADLAVEVQASMTSDGLPDSTVLAGSPITYTLTIRNNSPSVAAQVRITNELPSPVLFVTQTSGLSFVANGAALVWHAGDLQPWSSVSFEVVGTVAADTVGDIVNVVIADTSSAEGNTTNNRAQVTTAVATPQSQLSVYPVGPTLPVQQGANALLVAHVQNTGSGYMDQIVVTPPAHIAWVTVDTDGVTSLAPGASMPVTLTAVAAANQPIGYYRDFVEVSDGSGEERFIALTVHVHGALRTITVTVDNDMGDVLTNAMIHLSQQAQSVLVTQGVTQTFQTSTHTDGQTGRFDNLETGAWDYWVEAPNHQPVTGTLVVEDVEGQHFNFTLAGLAKLEVAPLQPVLGVVQGETRGQHITITNSGVAPLGAVSVNAPQNLNWVSLSLPASLSPIAPGDSADFIIFASPPVDLMPGIYQDYVTVTAGADQVQQIAFSVEVTDMRTRSVSVHAVRPDGAPVDDGSVVLTQQALSVQVTSGVTTTYNQQFSASLDGNGVAAFTDLPLGEYNYQVGATGFERADGSLTVDAGTGVQEISVILTPSPFTIDWTVVPVDQSYDITLTLTYDTQSEEPTLLIPPRYWSFNTCNPQLEDLIPIYNPSPIPLMLDDITISALGTDVEIGEIPSPIPAQDFVLVPVTATQTSLLGAGMIEASFSYTGVSDSFVTFTLNPSSSTSPTLNPGEKYSRVFSIEPVVFAADALYTVQIDPLTRYDWLSITVNATDTMHWTQETNLPVTLHAAPPVFLADGVYSDTARIVVTGSDGATREGDLVVTATKTALGVQVHTAFQLGPIPYITNHRTSTGVLVTMLDLCGEPISSPYGPWDWTPVVGGGGDRFWQLIGRWIGGIGDFTIPSFPQPISVPAISGYGHQQVRIEINQRMLLKGEAFRANLTLDNTSSSPIELISVDVQLTDADGVNQNAGFTVIPGLPTDLGTVEVGGRTQGEWLILPNHLAISAPEGKTFQVKAIVHYTWNGVQYTAESLPETITVYPAPELVITYELPPADCINTTFYIRTVIANQGQGPARNLRFSSMQPRIIENVSELPIGFEIVESLVDGVSQGSSLDLNLGNLAAGAQVEVVWRLTSNMVGRFVEFTSDYRQSNYEGLPLTPLIREINTVFQPLQCGGAAGPFYAITGQVTDSSGAPVPSVAVSAGSAGHDYTDVDGIYIIPGLPTGAYTVTPQKKGYTFEPVNRTVSLFSQSGGEDVDFVGTLHCQEATAPQPVLLIHGYGGPDVMMDDTQGFAQLSQWMDGYVEGCNLFYATGVRPNHSNAQNAQAISANLRAAAEKIRTWNPAWNGHFDIIAHSYGGLNARFYLELPVSGSTAYAKDQTLGIHVDNLFTLGTPHGGVDLADEIYPVALSIAFPYAISQNVNERSSALQLFDAVRLLNNGLGRQPNNVCYRMIGGDARQQLGISEPLRTILGRLGKPNDIAVSQRSSVYWVDSLFLRFNYPNIVQIANGDLHGHPGFDGINLPIGSPHWTLDLSNIRSYVKPDNTYLQSIKPYLGAPLSACQPITGQPSAPIDEPDAPADAGSPVLVQTGVITAAETITGMIPVDWEGEGVVYLSSLGDDLSLTLTDPAGVIIDPAQTLSDPNVEYGRLRLGEAALASYVFTTTAPGEWTFVITSTADADPVDYSVYVLPTSQLRLRLIVPEWQSIGLPVTLESHLTDADLPVTSATVLAHIARPDGVTQSLALLDDGNAPDTQANDGIYTGAYDSADIGGSYYVSGEARGDHQGRAFLRSAQAIFSASSGGATLADDYQIRLVDTDNDGLSEFVDVDVALNITQPSNLALSAALQDAQGEYITLANTYVTSATGALTATLRFAGHDIRLHGVNGPYMVTNLLLVDPDRLIKLDADAVVTVTAPYDHLQFDTIGIAPASIVLTGPVTATIGETVAFSTVISPATASRPIEYTWAISDHGPLTQSVVSSGHSITVSWMLPGVKTLTVSTYSTGGDPVNAVTSTHTITVENVAAPTVTPTSTPVPTPTATGTPTSTQVLVPLSDIMQVATGNGYTCVLTIQGGVKCWGKNTSGQLGDGTLTTRSSPVDVTGLTSGVTAISAGGIHVCALTEAGAVKCWGNNESGQLGNGTYVTSKTPVGAAGLSSGVIAVDSGWDHTCALMAAGGVKCWGNNSKGAVGAGSGTFWTVPKDVVGLSTGVEAVSAGMNLSCAVMQGGNAKCWGDNSQGQLGNGQTSNGTTTGTPVDVLGLAGGVIAISAGGYSHACAITTGGGVKCWGYNAYGELGDGTTTRRTVPTDVVGLTSGVTTISTSLMSHSCALTIGGGVKCWGLNWRNYHDGGRAQLGDGTTLNRQSPVDVVGLNSGVVGISAGGSRTCAVMLAGNVKCWGDNVWPLGDGLDGLARLTPVDVVGLSEQVTVVTTGESFTCTLNQLNTVECWGRASRLGNDSGFDSLAPVPVNGFVGNAISVSAEGSHICALHHDGSIFCWGRNNAGQLGDGTTTDRTTPVAITGTTSNFIAVAVGGNDVGNSNHTCAVTTDGVVFCWGGNPYGQLGDGTTINRSIPVAVVGLGSSVIAVSAGGSHTCALTTTGGVVCWGDNAAGQLGNGTTINSSTPVAVSGLDSGVIAISAGLTHSCALLTDGDIKCWGNNGDGQLGDGTTINRTTPVLTVNLGSRATSISAGWWHTCASTVAGNAKCWGRGELLGDGTHDSSSTPVNVLSLSSISAIDADRYHTCALTVSGNVKCWGSNLYGALGDGTAWRTTPVDVVQILSVIPTPTPTVTPTPTASWTSTSTPTSTFTPTATATLISSTSTPTYTNTPTPMATVTSTTTPTSSPTNTLSPMPTPTSTSVRVDIVWTTGPSMPTARQKLNAVAVNGKVYAIGGEGTGAVSLSTVEEYDPVTGFWRGRANMPTARWSPASGVVAEKIYVIGGTTGLGYNFQSKVEEYDPSTNTWRTRTAMPTPRQDLAVAVVDDKIYAIGGIEWALIALRTVEVYDPATDSWQTRASMPIGGVALSAAALNGKIYVVTDTAILLEYTVATDSWRTLAPMPTVRHAMALVAINNRLYAIGGYNAQNVHFNVVEEYNIENDVWHSATNMPSAHTYLGAAVVDGKIYAIGGSNLTDSGNGRYLSILEIGESPAFSPTAIVTSTPTPTSTFTPTATATDIPTSTSTYTPTPTNNPTATATPVPTSASTATHTPTVTPTSTQTGTATSTADSNQTTLTLTRPIAQVSMGAHGCAVKADGGVLCWGYNQFGQLGDGTFEDKNTPVEVVGLSDGVQAIASGAAHTCALTSVGSVQCWGNNEYGQLGDGTTTSRTAPQTVNGLSNGVIAVTAGWSHTCALTSTGGVYCWGRNQYGQLGDGTTINQTMPVAVNGLANGVAAISAGGKHTCALTIAGGVKCWGENAAGQLGDGTWTQSATPVAVNGLSSGIVAIAAGEPHTCALTNAGGVLCWGYNAEGMLGDGTTTWRNTPVPVIGLSSGVTAITAGQNVTCALTNTGNVKCWGANWYGQVGDGTWNNQFTPVDVSGLATGVVAITAGGERTCALTSPGAVLCWGYNGTGSLGDGTTTHRNTPVQVVGLTVGHHTVYDAGSIVRWKTLSWTNPLPAGTPYTLAMRAGSTANLEDTQNWSEWFTVTAPTDLSLLPSSRYLHIRLVTDAFLPARINLGTLTWESPIFTATPSATLSPSATLTPTATATVVPASTPTGPIGQWLDTGMLPEPRIVHAVVATENYIYVLGGHHATAVPIAALTLVEGAPILPDGTIGAWRTLTSLNTPRSRFAAVAHDGYLYAIGGNSGSGHLSSIERSQILADGTLAPWENIAALPESQYGFAAIVIGKYLYVVGGLYTRDVIRAELLADGGLGSWTSMPPLTEKREALAVVYANGYLYALGGHDGYSMKSSVERAQVQPDGSLSSWTPIRSMTSSRDGLVAYALGDTILALGGTADNATGQATLEWLRVAADGSYGDWQNGPSMSSARAYFGGALVHNVLYAIGGTSAYEASVLGSIERLVTTGQVPVTPTPSATPTASPTVPETPTSTPTLLMPTPTPTSTWTETATPTASPTVPETPTSTPTLLMPTPTPTSTWTKTATPTALPSDTATSTSTPTPTWTSTPTDTATPIEDLLGFEYELWLSPKSPRAGSDVQVGLTVYRIGGQSSVNVDVDFYAGRPDAGGLFLGTGRTAFISPNGSDNTSAVLWTPEMSGQVDLYAVIDPDNRIAESDETNNQIKRTLNVLPPHIDTLPPVVDNFAINGGASTTSDRNVALSVLASDSGANGGVVGLYFVEYLLNLELKIWIPTQFSTDWVPYQGTLAATYPWQLSDLPGMRYFQVWAMDFAGNISAAPKRSYINYVPATVHVDANAAHILRYDLQLGDQINIRIQPTNGDPDLYLWAPDALTSPRSPWYSNLGEGEIDQLSIVTPVSGTFQVEIIGYTDADFSLSVEIIDANGFVQSQADAVSNQNSSKTVRNSPIVPPALQPGETGGPSPDTVEQPEWQIFLPNLQR